MLFAPKNLLSTLVLAALLGAAPALAQQTVTKTKTKRNAARATSTPAPAAAPAAGTPPPPPPAPAGAPRAPHGPHGPHSPKGGPRRALQPVQSLSGTLTRYTTNPEGFYDGFVLPLNGAETTVHFPLHMAKAVMAAARPGQSIRFGAVAGPAGSPEAAAAATPGTTAPVARLELVSLGSTDTPLLMQPPARPAAPEAAPALSSVAGRIAERRTDAQGRLRGLVLADNTLLLVPPHVGEQLGDKLKVGETVQATGSVLAAREGMVAATDGRRLHAQTLTVGGVQFLVR